MIREEDAAGSFSQAATTGAGCWEVRQRLPGRCDVVRGDQASEAPRVPGCYHVDARQETLNNHDKLNTTLGTVNTVE